MKIGKIKEIEKLDVFAGKHFYPEVRITWELLGLTDIKDALMVRYTLIEENTVDWVMMRATSEERILGNFWNGRSLNLRFITLIKVLVRPIAGKRLYAEENRALLLTTMDAYTRLGINAGDICDAL